MFDECAALALGYAYDPERLCGLIGPKTKLLIINFPHNPTGFILDLTQLESITEIAEQNGLIIFSEEMYHRLVHDPKDNIPAVCDIYENGISLWGMAKSSGLAQLLWLGLRPA